LYNSRGIEYSLKKETKEMMLSQMIKKNLITFEIKARNKKEAIEEMVELISRDKSIKDKDQVLNAILEREKLGTTGIGNGIAIPHSRTDAAKDIVVAFARSREGLDFEALDKKPVNLLFMLVGPEKKKNEYLKVMSILARLFSKEKNRQALLEVATPKEIIRTIASMQEKEGLI
jgi:fructose-specific phosphotransferase system IIA component